MPHLINIFDICREGTHVLGPGNRYVVWVQGCDKRCVGCITPESQNSDDGTKMNVGDLAADIILADHIDGITISGGEPFLQVEALCHLLDIIRQARPELTVIVYTGYTYERLISETRCKELLDRTDVLIDGPYVEELNDNTGIKGSSNQRIISLTDRLEKYIDQMNSGQRKSQKILYADGTISNIGVPHKTTTSL